MKPTISRRTVWFNLGVFSILLLGHTPSRAQDILGAITGTVKDSTGAVVPDATVKARSTATNQEITKHTDGNGSYSALNLPIGMYEVTISKTGFQTETHTQVQVSGNRTSTVDASLKVATASASVDVIASTPLMNQTDTTNGYVVDALTMENTPLGTGSFTQLAIMAPGVHADFLSSSGSNGGLGNQAIYSNGQRASSNSFSLNGVDTNNLFNGNSTSGVTQYRFVLNEGENFPAGGGIQTATSVYAAIGQALPSPPVETMQEISVNAALYDATQGAHSGAHVGVITKSGTNGLHGELYEYFQNSDMEAAPFFINASPAYTTKVPFQVRNQFGATLGGPIKKDKLFYFLSYQGVRNADAQDSTQTDAVPLGLTNDRSVTGLLNMYNVTTGKTLAASQINPVSLAVMSAVLPNGQYLIPTPQITNAATAKSLGYDVRVQGPDALSSVDQGIANIDYLLSNSDRLTAKYYVQHDPTTTPFSPNSYFLGFPQTLTAGSQVASVENTLSITPSMTYMQRVGFTRMLAYASTQAELTAQQLGINLLGVTEFPLIEISSFDTTLGQKQEFGNSTSFGNAGMYQNNWEYTGALNWVKGRHTLSFGYQFDHTQMNIINQASASSIIDFSSLSNFLQGNVKTGSASDLFPGTGSASRYYRSNTIGAYINDNWKVRSNLTVTLGLRWDNDGGLSEKYGHLVGFNGSQYAYNAATDTITNDGLEFAGQNGASSTLMQNPQWGFAPRVGVAWSPRPKLTVRAGYGLYYDRGEYFTEFSPSAGGGFNGPFAVTLEPPFNSAIFATTGATFANPFGTTAPATPLTTPAAFQALLPDLAQTTAGKYPAGNAFGPFLFGGYDITNKLPYTQNWTFDLQYQASNSWLFTAGYVGNHGTHLVLPIPFNQPGIATASNPINGQTSSYGGISPLDLTNEPIDPSPSFAGNAELRVPYLGYDMNSVLYKAQGISNYDALELQARKRLSFGLQFTASYTWSHSLDEQSGEGIFFTGNNPLDPHSSYGNSDFDQTHVFLVNYNYTVPVKFGNKGLNQALGGWTISGQAVAQSGMPYSVYDYSGSVASIYYGGDVYIANPILPLKQGVTPQQAELQPGTLGLKAGQPVLNAADFYPQFVQPGTNGVPACNASGCDSYESLFSGTGRNIFRGPFQTRFDMGLGKQFLLKDKYRLRFNATAFNVFNHPDFDAPNNDVTYFADFAGPPLATPEGSLGYIQHTLGSSRFLQLALHLSF
jgi:hypothetical protein